MTLVKLADVLPREGALSSCLLEALLNESMSAQAVALELVREGYRLHYRGAQAPRFYTIDDPDFALLAGDRLYAAGLAVLSEVGDVDAVALLAKLIATCAEAHATDKIDQLAADWAEAELRLGG